jgi:hypothetical protein
VRGASDTVGGLLLATAVAIAGASGQLWVGWQSGKALEPVGWEDWEILGLTIGWDVWVFVGAAGAAVLLVLYTRVTLGATLKAGTTAPPVTPVERSIIQRIVDLFTRKMTEAEGVSNDAIEPVVTDGLEDYSSGSRRDPARGRNAVARAGNPNDSNHWTSVRRGSLVSVRGDGSFSTNSALIRDAVEGPDDA